MVKNTGCSCRGLKFNSQQLYGSSDLSVTPVPRLMTLSHRHTGRRNTRSVNRTPSYSALDPSAGHTRPLVDGILALGCMRCRWKGLPPKLAEPWKNLTSEPGSREDHQPEDRNPEKPV